MTDVFMVVGQLGTGGMTTAMFNRAAMLSSAGHHCSIVTFQYRVDFAAYVESLYEGGRLDRNIEVLNPYDLMRGQRSFRALTPVSREAESDELTEAGLLVQDDEYETQRFARYFRPDGSYVKFKRWARSGVLMHVDYFDTHRRRVRRDEFDEEGRRHHTVDFSDGSAHQERYFDADGACYLMRWYNSTTGRQQGVYEVLPKSGRVRHHSDNAAWHTAWLTEIARRCADTPVLICDGPRSVPKVMGVPPDAAVRLAVVHTNHFASPPFAPGSKVKNDHLPFLSRLEDLDGLLVLTQEQADDIVTDFGHKEKVYVMPNSVQEAPRPRVERTALRVSAYVKLIERKGVDDLILAFEEVVRVLPEARLDIYGEGTERDRFQTSINSRSLRHAVTLCGYTNNPDTEMAGSSLTVLSSKAEGFGYVIVESMLAGTPVVSYNCKYGPSDLIDSGVDGILVHEGDIASLADEIVGLLRRPEDIEEMGLRGRAKILGTYTPRVLVHRWELLFQELTDEARRSGSSVVAHHAGP